MPKGRQEKFTTNRDKDNGSVTLVRKGSKAAEVQDKYKKVFKPIVEANRTKATSKEKAQAVKNHGAGMVRASVEAKAKKK